MAQTSWRKPFEMLKTLFALPSTVWLLGLVSFFNDSASELVYPLVPLYLASVLMAGPKALGIIEGIAKPQAACSSSSSVRWRTR